MTETVIRGFADIVATLCALYLGWETLAACQRRINHSALTSLQYQRGLILAGVGTAAMLGVILGAIWL